MATLDQFPNGIPVPEPREYRCCVCDCVIWSEESRIYASHGWAHPTCVDDPWQAGGRP